MAGAEGPGDDETGYIADIMYSVIRKPFEQPCFLLNEEF